METRTKESPQYRAAKKKVSEIKGFYVHLAVYLIINIFIVVADSSEFFLGEGNVEISSFYTAFFWGIGLFAHWASVFGSNLFLGKNWEERKTREYMEREKQQNHKWE